MQRAASRSWDTGRVGGAIDGFYSTWDSARKTFGEGTPPNGEHLNTSSNALRGLDSNMAAAAPGDHWSGAAATAYDAANTEHRKVIGQLADLDRRLATEVNNGAQAVTIGRQNLESVRQWVAAAEANVPPGKAGEQMKLVIAQKGLAQIQEIIAEDQRRVQCDRRAGSGTQRRIPETGHQKFAPKEGEGPLTPPGTSRWDCRREQAGQGRRPEDTQGRRPGGRGTCGEGAGHDQALSGADSRAVRLSQRDAVPAARHERQGPQVRRRPTRRQGPHHR